MRKLFTNLYHYFFPITDHLDFYDEIDRHIQRRSYRHRLYPPTVLEKLYDVAELQGCNLKVVWIRKGEVRAVWFSNERLANCTNMAELAKVGGY